MIKTFVLALLTATGILAATGCSDHTVASHNLSKAADQFELERRIVFYNGITGEYILTIEGKCAVGGNDRLAVTCKTGAEEFKKHYLGTSDNVTWFSEQVESVGVDTYHYKVLFKPAAIVPDVDLL